MKKIIALILFIIPVFFLHINANASGWIADFNSQAAFQWWHVEKNDRAYVYMRYWWNDVGGTKYYKQTSSTNDFTMNQMQLNGGTLTYTLSDPNRTISNPDPERFKYLRIIERASEHDVVVFDGVCNQIRFIMNNAYNSVKPNEFQLINTSNDELLFSLKPGFSMSIFWYETTVIPGQTVEDLPLTTGNPINNLNGKWGTVLIESINSTTKVVDFTVIYDFDSYQISMTLSRVDFLEDVKVVEYYSIDDEKFFYFNYSNFSLLQTNPETQYDKLHWKGFAIWNLTENELYFTNKAWILTYIDTPVEPHRDVFAYFYMPNIDYDEIIKVDLILHYRYGVKNITTLWQQQYKNWQNSQLILEAGVTQLATFPNWLTTLYIASGSALAVGAIMSMIPGGQLIGIPLLAAGGIGLNLANIGLLNHIIHGGIDQMVLVESPSAQLKNKIETHYTAAAGVPITIDPEVPLYRLYFGRYNEAFTNAIEFCFNATQQDCEKYQEVKYTEVVWTSQGVVYFTDEPFIESNTLMNIDWFNSLPEEDPTVGDQIIDYIKQLAIPVVTVGFVFIGLKANVLDNPRKLIALVILYILIILVIL